MSVKKATKKTGRKKKAAKASEAAEFPASQERPACCPRCKSTRREQKGCVRTIKNEGVTRDGMTYNRIRFSRVKCADCPQHYSVSTPHYFPEGTVAR